MKDETWREYRRRICLAMDEMHRCLDEPIVLKDIARSAAFSKFHFHRIFKALVGENVVTFQRRLRLERAATWLIYRTQDDITSIALDSGFSTSQNFAKAFKKLFSISPSEFRNSYHSKSLSSFLKNSNIGNADWDPRRYIVLNSESKIDFEQRREAMSWNIKTQHIPARRVAYIRHIGPYDSPHVEHTFNTLLTWAFKQNLLETQQVLGLVWDDPTLTPPQNCRFDVCIELPEGWTSVDISTQYIEKGEYATIRGMMTEEQSSQVWDALFAEWLPYSGYLPADRPCLEVYHNDPDEHPDGLWDIELCLPVEALS